MIDIGRGSLRICVQSLQKNANTILFFLQKRIIGNQKTRKKFRMVMLN